MKYINPEVNTFLSFVFCVQMINSCQKNFFMTKIYVKKDTYFSDICQDI